MFDNYIVSMEIFEQCEQFIYVKNYTSVLILVDL